jgi:hypothetical protein
MNNVEGHAGVRLSPFRTAGSQSSAREAAGACARKLNGAVIFGVVDHNMKNQRIHDSNTLMNVLQDM